MPYASAPVWVIRVRKGEVSRVKYSRGAPGIAHGLSPRAGLALLQCARAWALIEGRPYVIPEDIQAVFPAVAGHRLEAAGDALEPGGALVEQVLNAVDVLA